MRIINMLIIGSRELVGGKAENPRKKCSYGRLFGEKCLGNCSKIKYENGSSPIGEYLNAVCKVTGDSRTEYI